MIKRALNIIFSVIILGGTIFLASFAGIEHRHLHYRSFTLSIENPQEQPMVTEEELYDTLNMKFGEIEGRSLDAISVHDIEQFLTSHPYIRSTNVYTTLNGDMVATVNVRVPLVRVITSFDKNFIIDTAGVVMPLSERHPVRLPVATGSIDVRLDTIPANVKHLEPGTSIRDIYELSHLISRDEFLNALTGQIFINEDGEMEMIPKIGKQVILVGTSENLKEKMTKLREFYLQVMKFKEWDLYQTINLTFDNQVVCSK